MNCERGVLKTPFCALCGHTTSRSERKTPAKTITRSDTQSHFSPGWNFGDPQHQSQSRIPPRVTWILRIRLNSRTDGILANYKAWKSHARFPHLQPSDYYYGVFDFLPGLLAKNEMAQRSNPALSKPVE